MARTTGNDTFAADWPRSTHPSCRADRTGHVSSGLRFTGMAPALLQPKRSPRVTRAESSRGAEDVRSGPRWRGGVAAFIGGAWHASSQTAFHAPLSRGTPAAAYQPSWTPTWPGSTPKLRSCGRSRRRRLSSAKPGKLARPRTLSHSGTASASLGRPLTTGPKNATPSGGWKWMIGVPTSLPVSARVSSVSRCSSASNEVSSSASASSAGRPASDRMGSRKVRTPPGSSPHGCHLGRNAARGHVRPRSLHPVTQVGLRLRTRPFRVRAFTNRNPAPPAAPHLGHPASMCRRAPVWSCEAASSEERGWTPGQADACAWERAMASATALVFPYSQLRRWAMRSIRQPSAVRSMWLV